MLLRKRLMCIIIIQDMQLIKTTLFNKLQQELVNLVFLIKAIFLANVEQHFKGKYHNVFSKQYQAFLLLQYE